MTRTEQRPVSSGYTAAATADDVLLGRSLDGATALVTGGYSGLGLETTRALARAGARVLVPARRPDLAAERLSGLPGVEVIPCDLADLASVNTAAQAVLRTAQTLEIVIAAGGIMATSERRVGPGWESQFATNHLGHFALVNHLVEPLANAEAARVVSYSSAGHHLSDVRWDDMHFEAGYDKWLAYGQAKTANALFAVHLDALGRDAGIAAFSLHPGSIITELQRDLTAAEQIERGWIDEHGTVIGEGFKTAAQGAATGVWAATAPELAERGGVYCEDSEVAPIAPPGSPIERGGVRQYATDAASARRLWEASAQMTGIDGFA